MARVADIKVVVFANVQLKLFELTMQDILRAKVETAKLGNAARKAEREARLAVAEHARNRALRGIRPVRAWD